VIAQLGFGFWQGWWLALQGIVVVVTVAICGTYSGNLKESAHET